MAYEQFAYAYDRLMADMPYEEWLKWTRDRCAAFGVKPRTIADLGCGTGAIAIPLAQDGLHVYGIDLSSDMLAVAQSKGDDCALPGNATLTWIEADLRDWSLPEPMELIVSFCDCMNYLLEEDEVVAALGQAFDGLAPGGLLLFDMHAPALLREYATEQPFVLDEDDIAYIWTCELDEEIVEIDHQLSIFVRQPGGDYARIDERHVQRAYEREWIERQLREAGFVDIQVTADFTDEAPASSSKRIFYSARKPGASRLPITEDL